jgi:YHS domain-containing protein
MKYLAPASLTVVALIAFSFAGCGSPAADPGSSPSATPAAGGEEHGDHEHGEDGDHEHGDHAEHGDHDHGDHDHGDHADSGQTAMEKMKTELAKLSPEDAASAEKQHMCPVTGEMLGTMGAPQKIDVDGQQVWVCCPGCKDTLLESPEKYLAKLNKE